MAPCADEPGSPAVAERLRQLVDQRCGYHDGLLLGDDRAKATFRVAIEQAEDGEEGQGGPHTPHRVNTMMKLFH
jgi:hypothetical protein